MIPLPNAITFGMSATDKLKSWFRQQKDNSVSFVVEKVLATKVAPYGELLDFQLHSNENRAFLKVLLRGEPDPVSLFIDEYRLRQGPAGTEVIILQARASRDWLSQLLQDFLINRPFPVPEKYAGYAKMLL